MHFFFHLSEKKIRLLVRQIMKKKMHTSLSTSEIKYAYFLSSTENKVCIFYFALGQKNMHTLFQDMEEKYAYFFSNWRNKICIFYLLVENENMRTLDFNTGRNSKIHTFFHIGGCHPVCTRCVCGTL